MLHPANNSRIQDTVDPIFEMLQEHLEDADVATILERSAALNLEVVVREQIAQRRKQSDIIIAFLKICI